MIARSMLTSLTPMVVLVLPLIATAGCSTNQTLAVDVAAGDTLAAHALLDRHAEAWRPDLQVAISDSAMSYPVGDDRSFAGRLAEETIFCDFYVLDNDMHCLLWRFDNEGAYRGLELLGPLPSNLIKPAVATHGDRLYLLQPSLWPASPEVLAWRLRDGKLESAR